MMDIMDTKVHNLLGMNLKKEEIGLEIELEGYNNPFPVAPKGWVSEHDGSLKADYAIEYVTNGPILKTQVPYNLNLLRKRLSNSDVNIKNSIRTGVHVHINCQNLTFKQVYGFALTYLTMERALTNFCGHNRVGNQFCLRACDAEYLIDQFEYALTQKYPNVLKQTGLRYSSLNFLALFKFGSLEFRAMQTRDNLEHLEEWVDILYRIRKYGMKLKSYREIAEDISGSGPEIWMENIIGRKNFNLSTIQTCP